jgi:signal transduction histidine kinase/ligand-binding sensor domain-containing protein/CheY-like chemotaxis protein/AraC-like DNA-binding protein
MNLLIKTLQIFLLCFVLFINGLIGQTTIGVGSLVFDQLNTNEGLSHSLVSAIIRDSRGYMWFGTEDGLNRFDGLEMKVFRATPEDRDGVRAHSTRLLFEDSKGYLWIAFSNGGVSVHDPRLLSFTNYDLVTVPGSTLNSKVNCFLEDRDGSVWIGTDKGLFCVNHEKGIVESYTPGQKGGKSISDHRISSLLLDKDGDIWVGTWHGLNLFDRSTGDFIFHRLMKTEYNNVDTVNQNKINALAQDEKGNIFVGTAGRGVLLFRKDMNDIRKTNGIRFTRPEDLGLGLQRFQVTEFLVDKDKLWIGTNFGLYRMTRDELGRFTIDSFLTAPEYADVHGDNHVRRMVLDITGNIWFSVNGSRRGLYRYNKPKGNIDYFVHNPMDPKSVKSNEISSIYADKQGDVWIGTTKAGVSKVNLYQKPFYHLAAKPGTSWSLNASDVYSVFLDDLGILWIGTIRGLNRVDRIKKEVKTYSFKLNSNRHLSGNIVSVIRPAGDKALWIGYMDSQLSLFYPDEERFYHYIYDPYTLNSGVNWSVRDALTDMNGNLWIASYTCGVSMLNPDRRTFTYYTPGPVEWQNIKPIHEKGNQVSDYSTVSLYLDRGNVLWVGAMSSGVDKMDLNSGIITNYPFRPGQPGSISSGEVKCIHRDSKGRLWIGTAGGGLNLLDEVTGKASWFTVENGLPNNTIHGIVEDHHGFLWLSTNGGICRLDPEDMTIRTYTLEDGLPANEFNSNAYFKDENTGELYFGGSRGLTWFHPDSIKDNPNYPGIVLTGLSLHGKPVKVGDTLNKQVVLPVSIDYLEKLVLKHRNNDFMISFAALHYAAPALNKYRYKLEGHDKDWIIAREGRRFAIYSRLPYGKYTFRLECANPDGIWNPANKTLTVVVLPPWWSTWWFRVGLFIIVLALVYGLYKLRVSKLEYQKKKLELIVKERTRRLEEANAKIERRNSQLEEQKLKTEAMALRLHEADQLKLKFFANLSHEFKTPLTLILEMTRKMEGKLTSFRDEEVGRLLDKVKKNSRELLSMVNQLLEFRRIDTEGYKLNPQWHDVKALVNEVYESFSELALGAGIQYRLELHPEKGLCFIDSNVVEKVLRNLLSNAFKFTPDQGEITLKVTITSENVIIIVSDTGIGIDADSKGQIFDRFFRVEDKSYRRFDSSGVGLALSNELVSLHGGQIKVESEPGKGSEFRVEIPLDPTLESIQVEKEVLSADNPVEEEDTSVDKPLLLVVEDNNDLREFLVSEFYSDYQVLSASNGEEAFDLAHEKLPDLIVSDVMIPGMTGLDLCARIKENQETSHIPVILLTARSTEDQVLEGLSTGADDYVTKPFNMNILLLRARNILLGRKRISQKFLLQPETALSDLATNKMDQEFLEKITALIAHHLSDSTLDGNLICRELSISKSGLYKKIKTLTGVSLNIFIRNIRLRHAAELLRQGKASVAGVAFDTGFNDPAYFSRCFSEYYGYSPKKLLSQS